MINGPREGGAKTVIIVWLTQPKGAALVEKGYWAGEKGGIRKWDHVICLKVIPERINRDDSTYGTEISEKNRLNQRRGVDHSTALQVRE